MLNTKLAKKQTNECLNQAISNLDETIENGYVAIEILDEQGEILDNVVNNLNRINSSIERSDSIVEDMNNPWIQPVNIKKQNAEFLRLALEQKNLETDTLKRGRKTGNWNKRFFRLDYDKGVIKYHSCRKNSHLKPMGIIELNCCRIKELPYDTVDNNNMTCDKDNCFEIIDKTTNKSDTIHIAAVSEYNKWINLLRFITQSDNTDFPIKFGNQEQNQKIDLINNKLDEISYISVEINNKTDSQIKNIQKINNFASNVDDHIVKTTLDVKKIK